jgi:predicted MFS family arabinose efflux permease
VAVGPAQALGPEVAHQVFGHAALYGGVSTAFGVGLFGGSLLALRWQPEHPVLMGIYACLPWTFEGLIFALGPPYVVLLGAAAIGGFGIALFEVWWVTSLTRSVPPAAMSRVSSVDWMGSLGLLPVGLFLAGPIAATFGARETLAGGAVLSALMTLAISRVPSVRAFRSPEVLA